MEIRMPQQGGVNASFQGVRTRGPQIQVNTGSLTGALEGLYEATGKSVKQPVKDFSYWKDIVRAGEQIVSAGTEYEDTQLKIALDNQRITDSKRSMEIDNQLSKASGELKIKLAESGDHPEAWDKIASEFVSTLNVDTSDMTPESANTASAYFDRWKDQQILGTRLNSVVQNQKNFKETADLNINNAIEEMNPAKMAETLVALRDSNTISHEEMEARLVDGGHKIQAREFEVTQRAMVQAINQGDPEAAATILKSTKSLNNEGFIYLSKMANNARLEANARTEVLRDPQKAVEELNKVQAGKPSEFSKYNFSELQVQKYKDAAYERSYENSNQRLSMANDDLVNGTLKTPEQLDTDPRYAGLLPSKKQMVKDAMAKDTPKDDSREFMAYAWAALNTPVVNDPKDPAYSTVQMHIAGLKNGASLRFTGGYKEQLNKIIDDHFNGNNDEEAELIRSLSDGFKTGMLGDYKVPYVEHGNRWEINWGTLGQVATASAYANIPAAAVALADGDLTTNKTVPGTPLSPVDQARAALGDKLPGKLKPGMLVVDQQKYTKAAEQLYKAVEEIKRMGKAGRTPQEKKAYRDSILNVVPLQGLMTPTSVSRDLPATRLNEATEVFNSLFPTNGTE